jgi:divalent metal cation (Fe/Co/Zn/Cd) transporter
LTHRPNADDWAVLGASVVILYNAAHQMRLAILELADRAPDPTIESDVRRIAQSVNGVSGLDKCHARKMGFSFYVDLHVIVSGTLSVRDGHHIAHHVEDAVLQHMLQVEEVLVHIEPEEELLRTQEPIP